MSQLSKGVKNLDIGDHRDANPASHILGGANISNTSSNLGSSSSVNSQSSSTSGGSRTTVGSSDIPSSSSQQNNRTPDFQESYTSPGFHGNSNVPFSSSHIHDVPNRQYTQQQYHQSRFADNYGAGKEGIFMLLCFSFMIEFSEITLVLT